MTISFIHVVESMTEKANVALYTSNQKTFGDEQWRYCRTPDALSHYKLEYRIVLARCGGLSSNSYWQTQTKSGLSERAGDLINDLRTVATNLGFDASMYPGAHNVSWESNKKNAFHARDLRTGDVIQLI